MMKALRAGTVMQQLPFPSLPASWLVTLGGRNRVEETPRYLFKRLSILLIWGNVALILNMTPFHVESEVNEDQDFDA